MRIFGLSVTTTLGDQHWFTGAKRQVKQTHSRTVSVAPISRCASWRSTRVETSLNTASGWTNSGDAPTLPILHEVTADEREHYQTLGNLIRSRRPLPVLPPEQANKALEELLRARKQGQMQAASRVGDMIYGINDGRNMRLSQGVETLIIAMRTVYPQMLLPTALQKRSPMNDPDLLA